MQPAPAGLWRHGRFGTPREINPRRIDWQNRGGAQPIRLCSIRQWDRRFGVAVCIRHVGRCPRVWILILTGPHRGPAVGVHRVHQMRLPRMVRVEAIHREAAGDQHSGDGQRCQWHQEAGRRVIDFDELIPVLIGSTSSTSGSTIRPARTKKATATAPLAMPRTPTIARPPWTNNKTAGYRSCG
jgi:hypothetical protein